MKLKLFIFTFLICALSFSQTKGTLNGTITDKELNNETLPFANVTLKGTKVNTTTDIDGKYSISVPAGKYVVQFSFIGYEPVEESVTVEAGKTTTVNKALAAGGYKLDDVVVKSTVNREKESALLLQQKNAVEIKQEIGAQELSRKGVSDVATAVTKTTGITKQEGSGNIFVRGLGDRYNSTTMNGLPVPSNNPENKNMNLEIFSTDIVEYISIDKIYDNHFFGDFAGGNINIISKDYNGKGFFKIDASTKVNSNAISNSNFRLQAGFNNFGFENRTIPTNTLSSYNFKTLNMSTKSPIAGSFGFSAGNSFPVGKEGKINFFVTANYDNEYTSIKDGSLKGSVSGAGVVGQDYKTYTNDSYSTNTTVMANLGYKINEKNKINFNTLFINNSTQSLEEGKGLIIDLANDGNGYKRFSNFSQNTIYINQLLGNHKLSDRLNLNWKLGYNIVNADVPDRDQNVFNINSNGYTINAQSAPNNNRYFQFLTEKEMATVIAVDYKIGKKDNDYLGKITVGYSGRSKESNFKATQFNFKTQPNYLSTLVDPENLDTFYNQQNFDNTVFKVTTFRGGIELPNALDPQKYLGQQNINGAFTNIQYNFGKLAVSGGLRFESISQTMSWDTQLSGVGNNKFDKPAFLPNLVLKYGLTDLQNLRLGFSKTYTLPQFKEKAPFIYEKFGQAYIGNKNIYASDDYNLDLKWEIFPTRDDLISVTAFGKYIQNPINQVVINSSTNDISYINTGNFGTVYGFEAEYRKKIFDFETKKLSAGLNASYLNTNQELDNTKITKETTYSVAFNDKTGKFTGASDLLLNADLSFFNEWNNKESNLNTTLAYSLFSDRVYAIGTNDKGNMIDKSYGSLDLVLKSKIKKHIGWGLVAKNLLNPTINRVQANKTENGGDVNILSYKKGINLSLSINYQF